MVGGCREGGVRADAFVNGGLLPDKVRGKKLAGGRSYVHLCDFYATFCGLAGVDPADSAAERLGLPPVDSMDMWPLFSGENLTSPRTEILFTPLRGLANTSGSDPYDKTPSDMRDPMIIVGEWKLILGVVDQCWWQGPQYPNGSSTWDTHATWINCTTPTKKACLFNIIEDPTEHFDRAAEQPALVDQLLARMQQVQTTVYDPDRGENEAEAACEAVEANKGFWGPWKKAR